MRSRRDDRQLGDELQQALDIVCSLGRVESTRRLHWVCFAAQELGRIPPFYHFAFSGGEPFSRELDLGLVMLKAGRLLEDVPEASLRATAAGRAASRGTRWHLSDLAELGLEDLAALGRVLYLQVTLGNTRDISETARRRFLMSEESFEAAHTILEELRASQGP